MLRRHDEGGSLRLWSEWDGWMGCDGSQRDNYVDGQKGEFTVMVRNRLDIGDAAGLGCMGLRLNGLRGLCRAIYS